MIDVPVLPVFRAAIFPPNGGTPELESRQRAYIGDGSRAVDNAFKDESIDSGTFFLVLVM